MRNFRAPPMWTGETCFILGGGPSLQLELLPRLKDQRVIATNNAFKIAPWSQVLFFMDYHWARQHTAALNAYTGLKVTISENAAKKYRGKWMTRGKAQGLNSDRTRLNTGMNSGHCAINLAVHFNISRIILLGFDMRAVEEKHNWHDEHKRVMDETVYASHYIVNMRTLVQPLKDLGIETLNATPDSALTCFPFVNLEEYL